MVICGDTIECPMCGKHNLERERHLSTCESREECTYCGYFHEATFGFEMTEEELVEMHFKSVGSMYQRKGFIKKTKKKV